MLRVAPEDEARQEFALTLDEICRRGAERMLAIALEAEVDSYLERHQDARDERGRALVVRNGHARPRTVVAGAGAIQVRAHRVDDRRIDPTTGERHRFRSSILPPYARRSPKVAEMLPLLYLHGLSSRDFVPALTEFVGSEAGLSAAAITRLTGSWSAEREAFMARDLSKVDYVYVWVDGIHFSVRLGKDDRLCVLVMVGVRADGTKNWSRSQTGTGNRQSPGPSCSGMPSAEGCGLRCSRSATGRSGSGRPSETCSPRPGGNGTGCTRWPTS
jgi:putative transposase